MYREGFQISWILLPLAKIKNVEPKIYYGQPWDLWKPIYSHLIANLSLLKNIPYTVATKWHMLWEEKYNNYLNVF